MSRLESLCLLARSEAKAAYYKRLAIVPGSIDETLAIDMELPSGVKLRFDRFGKHLDLEIRMPPEAGGVQLLLSAEPP